MKNKPKMYKGKYGERRVKNRIGRNDKCYCNSNVKYKYCCLKK